MELVFIGKDSKKSVSFEENRNELLLKKVNMKIHTVKKHNIKLGNISTYPASITALQIKKIYKISYVTKNKPNNVGLFFVENHFGLRFIYYNCLVLSSREFKYASSSLFPLITLTLNLFKVNNNQVLLQIRNRLLILLHY